MSFFEIVALMSIACLLIPIAVGLTVNLVMSNYYAAVLMYQDRLYETARKFKGLDNGPQP